MSDQSNLLPPSDGSFGAFGPITPSGLTPNTRSEAEAALTHNSIAQTDSAAPDSLSYGGTSGRNQYGTSEDGTTEAQKAYRRPGVVRTSSANYETALKRAQQESVSSNMSTDSNATDTITGATVASPPSTSTPFPPPGQGVVPLNYGVGATAADPIKKTRSRGLSLSTLAQQQGWNEQDYKRIYSTELMEKPKDETGYDSEAGPKPKP
ncbi:uncharacterized protein K460DRAFT_327257 [Cucurbitaria berberidis CBS 394.84]|uniref:Uncharacterized protein n=1 Tax=Cucurbitaria berberidis CBS 394.84 TaxID=1168544 RepID=A0A9P4LC78_9PLEO|nr:uncharacterized protein K460DRAFT_327257 [Cucurbitaria berberidis CBS 394.84]KAF1850416.1 hypothetical protein K460DRAFT_327257 [Cucurbitaria berberidis CBS 394.84]